MFGDLEYLGPSLLLYLICVAHILVSIYFFYFSYDTLHYSLNHEYTPPPSSVSEGPSCCAQPCMFFKFDLQI